MDNKRNSESLSRADTMEKETEAEVMLNKIRELKDLVESKDKQLSDERLKADIKLQKKMLLSRNLQTSLDEAKQERDEMAERLRRKEMVDLRRETDTEGQLKNLKIQLQAERLRADTLQKEQEEFRQERPPVRQEKASRDLKKVWNLEVKGLSLEAKALQMKDIKIKELEELIAKEQHPQKNNVMTRYLQTSLDEAKQERDEMARVMRKDQEHFRRKTNTEGQTENLDLDGKLASNTAIQDNKIKELQDLVESLKKQLQAERLRADTLQREQTELRQERPPGGQETASRDLKQVWNLEVKGLSLGQEAKALQMKNIKIEELEELIAKEQHLQKNKVLTRYLKTSLDEAKQERDEIAQRLNRKDQEHLRRKTNIEGQTENLDLDGKLASSRACQYNKIKELQHLVENKDNQLQAERLRADTLQKELEDFRLEVQEKASRDMKQVQNLEEEKRSLDSSIASQDIKLQNKMLLSRNLQTSLDEAKQERDEMAERLRRKEMVELRRETDTEGQLKNLKNQLQAERLRADTLQKEQDEFRQERPPVRQEKASRDLKKVWNLEVKGLSLEAKALQMKDIKIKELEELIAKEQHPQKNNVMTRYLQTSLDEAKQERDEMARVMRKDQEHFRRKTNTEGQTENLDLDGKLASNTAIQDNKIKELQDLVESLKKQLQAERLRADTLQREQTELRQERPPGGQETASRDLKQVWNLEVKGLSLGQEAKALQMKNIKIEELEELIAKEQHLQKNKVLTRYLKTSLDEAKQERDEIAQRLNRKDQEHLRRKTNTEGQTENLDLDGKLASSRACQYNKIKELQHLVENKDNQLQAERLRADTLQKELEDFRLEVQEKASRDMKQVQNLEEEKRSLDSSIASQDIKLQNKMLLSRNLQTSLDEAKQERDEMAERLRRKEMVDLRRETDTNVQLEDLKNQLQAERLRSDTLQKEQEDFRWEVQQKASRELKQVQNLEEEKRSLEQPRQIRNDNRIQKLEELITSQVTQQQDHMKARQALQEEVKDLQEEVSTRAIQQTNRIKELQDLIESSKNQLQTERLEVQDRLIEMENVSMWRRFKKAMTPHSRRQYKHLRMQWQDQEENHSSSVPPSPPNMPRP
ncbi:cingulin-like protein 1 [Notolabrus celidotus]|uniref:cingulin-like protein 1 n=1 Tax=Notolabrus celidotus TaxID=1203425 RepID=UPI00148F4D08|nr:cingulin-like protein 1 [Notolabrus celidotus]